MATTLRNVAREQGGDSKAVQHLYNPLPSHWESTDAEAQVMLHTLHSDIGLSTYLRIQRARMSCLLDTKCPGLLGSRFIQAGGRL